MMNLSRLKWVKIVTPPKDWRSYWAYCRQEIEMIGQDGKIIIDTPHELTIFPLGFKNEKVKDLDSGDLILLTQHAKLTHIVEVLDDKPYEEGSHEKGSWFHRYVKIVWWKPNGDWEDLPHRSEILGFELSIYDGSPHLFTSFKSFSEKWGDGGLKDFQQHLSVALNSIQ